MIIAEKNTISPLIHSTFSSSFRASPTIVTVIPVGDYERVLKKESARRRNKSNISFGQAILTVVAIVVFGMWIVISSWATVQEPTLFTITNTSSGKTTEMLVTPDYPVRFAGTRNNDANSPTSSFSQPRTEQCGSHHQQFPRSTSAPLHHHGSCSSQQQQQQHYLGGHVSRLRPPSDSDKAFAGPMHGFMQYHLQHGSI